MFDRLLCGDAESPSETLLMVPPEGGKRELVSLDGTAVIDFHITKGIEVGIFQELAHNMAGGVIEDEAKCPSIRRMFRQENH
jgi:hypothetical protein